MAFLTKRRFFQIIRENKSVYYLKNSNINDLHYLQLIFFKPFFTKISIILFLSFSLLPLFIIKVLWIKLLFLVIILYTDYKNRKMIITGLKNNVCLYELLEDGK